MALLVALIATPGLTWPVVVIGTAALGLFLAVLEGFGNGHEAPDATSVNDR